MVTQKKKPGDFKRPKRRVGRKAPKPSNVTNAQITSRRINMFEQSALQEKGSAVTQRNLNLHDLLTRAVHYNGHVRRDAFHGLKELAKHHPHKITLNASVVLERILQGLLDDEEVVREAVLAAWDQLLRTFSYVHLQPFADWIAVYLCSGMTHLQPGVRHDILGAISAILRAFPVLFVVDGKEKLGQLIQNFGDLLSSKQTQHSRYKTTYSSESASKKKAKQQSRGGTGRAPGKGKVLHFRFRALEILHSLLQAMTQQHHSHSDTAQVMLRTCNLNTCEALLLYPDTKASNVSSNESFIESWAPKSCVLFQPLLDLWLETCVSDMERISATELHHLRLTVECVTFLLKGWSFLSRSNQHEQTVHKYAPILEKIQRQFTTLFPIFPATLESEGSAVVFLSWTDLNLTLSQYICQLLQSEKTLSNSQRKRLTKDLLGFVVSIFQSLLDHPEYRQIPSAANTLAQLLNIVKQTAAVASEPQWNELVGPFTNFVQSCSYKSAAKRLSIIFMIEVFIPVRSEQNSSLKWPSNHQVVVQWACMLLKYCQHMDPICSQSQQQLFRRVIQTILSVLKALPSSQTSDNESSLVDSLVTGLLQFFETWFSTSNETNTMCSTITFAKLSSSIQQDMISLLYYVPSYPQTLLKTLASLFDRTQPVSSSLQTFLLEVLSYRKESIELGPYISFHVTVLLGNIQQNNERSTELCTLGQDSYEVSRRVCQNLRVLNLNNSLVKLLAPTLSKYCATLDGNRRILHALLLCFHACLAECTSLVTNGQETLTETHDAVSTCSQFFSHDLPHLLCFSLRESHTQSKQQSSSSAVIAASNIVLQKDTIACIVLYETVLYHVLVLLLGAQVHDRSTSSSKSVHFKTRGAELDPQSSSMVAVRWLIQHPLVHATMKKMETNIRALFKVWAEHHNDAARDIVTRVESDLEVVYGLPR